MSRRTRLLGALHLCGLLLASPALAALRLHPDNPRYLLDTRTNKPVLLTGYNSIVPEAPSYDYIHDPLGLDDLAGHRVPYARVWHLGDLYPWACSGTAGGTCNGSRYDLTRWNPTYWTRLLDALTEADRRGIAAELHLFDKSGMIFSWDTSPWASDNNVNGTETNPMSSGSGIPGFYQLATRPVLRGFQDAYVDKMVDMTIGQENLIYEIENEHAGDHVDYATHFSSLIKSAIAARHPASPRLVSYSTLQHSSLESLFSIPTIDIVNLHCGGECEADPDLLHTFLVSHWARGKMVNVDEFGNGVGDQAILRRQAWTILTSGGHFHFEDPEYGLPFDILENVRSFLARSAWDFVRAAPDDGLVKAGKAFCMSQPGVEALCYLPQGGGTSLALAAGSYRSGWWNPRTGGFFLEQTFTHAGPARSFTSPPGGDFVLWIHQAPDRVAVLSAPPAGAIRVDGDPSDWDLGALTAVVRGGEVGEGTVAALGREGPISWSAGHLTAGQYPPAVDGDASAKLYVRHSATDLFLLVRVQDGNRQTPSPAGSNWMNDAIELYFDPGAERSGTALQSSTSAFQLVIDAANQKNVYVTSPGYASQLLAGITSAVKTDATGYWLEVKLAKSATSPALSQSGELGFDLLLHDNDGAEVTAMTWADPTISAGFPSKVPALWGTIRLGLVPPSAADGGQPTADAGQVPEDAGQPFLDGGADAEALPAPDVAGGCGCGAGAGVPSSLVWLLGALLARLRRRR